MSRRRRLERELRGFTDRLSGLLNRTVTHGIALTTVAERDGSRGWLGYKISKRAIAPGEAVPLTVGATPAYCFLSVSQRLRLTPDRRYLVTEEAHYGLYLSADFDGMVFHYDYEREPGRQDYPYPMPHVQIHGDSNTWQELCERCGQRKPLEDLHFPVGGRRYRPTLEDVIHFLVSENVVAAHDGWATAVEENRSWWEEGQLRAAVRGRPDIARDVLAELDREG